MSQDKEPDNFPWDPNPPVSLVHTGREWELAYKRRLAEMPTPETTIFGYGILTYPNNKSKEE